MFCAAERLKPVDLGIEVDGGDLGFWYVKQGTTEARTWRWLLVREWVRVGCSQPGSYG